MDWDEDAGMGVSDEDDDDEVKVVIVDSPLKPSTVATSSSSLGNGNLQKKAKFIFGQGMPKAQLYQLPFSKSDDHKVYERQHPIGTGVFGTVHIVERSNKNYVMECMGCKWRRTGAIGLILDHLEDCKLELVEEQSRPAHHEYLLREVRLFNEKYRRDMQTAVAKRQVITPTVPTLFKDTTSRRTALLQSVSRASLGCNWSMLQAENPYFRQMLLEVSHMKLSAEDLNVLARRSVLDEMNDQAKGIQDASKARWTQSAKIYGGSFTVDGWTAARNFGMVGLALFSLGIVFYESLIHAGKSSKADDYLEKVVPHLPIALIYFMCTDGASNMIKLGVMMADQHLVLPQLCAAHGFSLVNHYIGKCFEGKFGFVTRMTGIVAFFNRSPQRMEILREISKKDVGFIKVAKTRFAYMTFVFLRILRLRSFAQIAMTKLSAPKSTKDEQEFDDDSKYSKVKNSLNDDTLFEKVELFVRVTFPVVLIMREFDRGAPMTGFVFWAFYCIERQVDRILDAVVECNPDHAALKDEVMRSIAFIWEKRHTPMLSFAYLTNPLFHETITDPESGLRPYDLADHFLADVKLVLRTMIRKRYPGKTDQERISELSSTMSELDRYFSEPFEEDQVEGARTLLASEWWNGHNAAKFPVLAYYAVRVHAAPCVSSSLERFFSMMTNVQTTIRSSLKPERAALFTAAHHELVNTAAAREVNSDDRKSSTKMALGPQARIVEFVRRLEKLLDSDDIPDIDAEGIRDVETWLESVAQSGGSLIYRDEQTTSGTTEGGDADNNNIVVTESAATSQITPTIPTLLEELEKDEISLTAATSRMRRPPKRYIEHC